MKGWLGLIIDIQTADDNTAITNADLESVK